ncbi:MAG: sugar phosphorylase [Pseudomonadota bacterium]
MNQSIPETLREVVADHVSRVYESLDSAELAEQLVGFMGVAADSPHHPPHENHWDNNDVWMITYGDSIVCKQEKPLQTLKRFIDDHLADTITGVHILPFFPFSSDDGFSVINYAQVNDSLGSWADIQAIGEQYDVMADLVINHCSARSQWFENFKQCKHPGKDFFIESDPELDLSEVVRPRTSELLKPTQTLDGVKHVWCTFSHDQVDLNFANPAVLIEMVKTLRLYIDQGVRIFRLDAVAFLWKEIGTDCIHLPKTHEIVRLLRTLIVARSPEAIVITETNVPNHENLSYFGNANEAHAVYNFSLPPLVLHALTAGTSEHLKRWQMSMPPAQFGTFYFNFLASHDGIGLRPAKGLLSKNEINALAETMQNHGAKISWRSVGNADPEPYEINVALFDALKGTHEGIDKWQVRRFICAHAMMLALEGIPGVYVHSLFGTENDYARMDLTRHNRAINRHKWQLDELLKQITTKPNHHAKVFSKMRELIQLRRKQPAFHPNASQYTLHLGDEVFAFWRQSIRRDQSIFCIHNVTNRKIDIPLSSINLIDLESWHDLVSGRPCDPENGMLTLKPYRFVWLSNNLH